VTPNPTVPTPVLSDHARERCVEMGISTKVAKWIVRHADIRRPGNPGSHCVVATCKRFPDYAVVYGEEPDGTKVVVTVLFNTTEFYARAGATYVPVEGEKSA